MLLVSIDGYIYDIANFDHPGEGICGCCLKHYKYKEISSEFFRYHMTDEPDYILEQARKYDIYDEVYYICYNFFKSRISICFYYDKNNNYDNLLNDIPNNYFFITPHDNKTYSGYYFHIFTDKHNKVLHRLTFKMSHFKLLKDFLL